MVGRLPVDIARQTVLQAGDLDLGWHPVVELVRIVLLIQEVETSIQLGETAPGWCLRTWGFPRPLSSERSSRRRRHCPAPHCVRVAYGYSGVPPAFSPGRRMKPVENYGLSLSHFASRKP